METLPDPTPGFVRIQVRLPRHGQTTPGELVRMSGVALEDLGPVQVLEGSALVDVRANQGKTAREHLERIGSTRLVAWQWLWLKLHIGRNHGLNIGQLKKVMLNVDALPLGRILVNNTHTLVGVQEVVAEEKWPKSKSSQLCRFCHFSYLLCWSVQPTT